MLIVDEGNSVRQVLGVSPARVRSVMVGVVDRVTVDDTAIATA